MKTNKTKSKKINLNALNNSPLRSLSGVTMAPVRILNAISPTKR